MDPSIINEHQDRDGMLRRALERIIQLYKDRTHFVYELLQNAEDAQAHIVKFVLYGDRLEVFHDGKPFTVSNVRSLFDIGLSDKANDLNQIGEFGVGFKSVFSICERVQFFSNPSNFRVKNIESAGEFGLEICDFYKAVKIPISNIGKVYTTKFVFPFAVDKPFLGFKKIEELRSRIKEKLENLSETTLLFMKNIEVIEYEINLRDETKAGSYMLDKKEISDHCCCIKTLSEGRETKDTQKDMREISYIVFSRKLDEEQSNRSVDIAFSYVEKNGEWQFVPTTEKHIFVYFPTGTESKLNFIVQGPYRTTPSRSEIPADEPENIGLAAKTAKLLYDSVLELKAMGKLNLSLLNVLPIEEKNFYEERYLYSVDDTLKPDFYIKRVPNNLLSTVYDKTIELFKQQQILPCKQGGFTNANQARLLRSRELAEIFDDDTLTALLGEHESVHWLPEEITDNSQAYQALYGYLNQKLKISQISPDNLARLIEQNPDFLPSKKEDTAWLTRFYSFLSSVPGQFNQARGGAMLTAKIVLTNTGRFVEPFRKNAGKYLQNVFIPFEGYEQSNDGKLLFVDPVIYSSCKEFFEDVLHLEKPKEYDIWIKDIKQRFETGYHVTNEQHIKDISLILKYLQHPDYQNELTNILHANLLLKCYSEEDVWRNPYKERIYFVKNKDGIDLQEYFRNIVEYRYIDDQFYNANEISYDDLKQLSVRDNIIEGADIISGEYDNGKPGRHPTWHSEGSFRWRWTLSYLAQILNYIEKNAAEADAKIKSSIILKMLFANEHILKGNISITGITENLDNEFSIAIQIILSKKRRTNLSYYSNEFLKQWNGKWLFTNDDTLVSSMEISKYDLNRQLYGDVRLDSNLYEILKFKKDNRDIAEQIFKDYNSLSVERRDAYGSQWLKECFGITPEQLTHILDSNDEDGSNEFFNFPIDDVGNWESVERHAEQMFAYAEPVLYAEIVRSIRVSKNSSAVKTYLQQAYRLMGNRSRYACQLCHHSSANIECCQVDEKGNADKELEPMHLCLCPNCAAKFRAYRNSSAYSAFQSKLRSLSYEQIKDDSPVIVPLDGEEVWFTQRHIAEIISLLKLQDRIQQDN